MASPGQVLGFMWELGMGTRILFFIGCICGCGNGTVYPILAYLFSNSFSDIAGAGNGLQQVRELAYLFMIVGLYALAMATFQTSCMEIVASRASRNFRLQWFNALMRQDAAYFDVYDVAAIANTIGPNSAKFQRGLGRKFGEGIQFFTTFLGGLIYAFYSSWRVAFVILAVLPFVSLAALGVLSINQTKSARASKSYSTAGSIAYSTVSAIRTVLSLNAVTEMISQYKEATLETYRISVKPLWRQGFAFGSMLGSFIGLYCILTLYGTYLLYEDVSSSGCDPSASVPDNVSCSETGSSVFGAMLGVAFAGQGISQVGNFVETFSTARVAAYNALKVIARKPGAPREEVYEEEADDDENEKKTTDAGTNETNEMKRDIEAGEPKLKAILPEYVIDSQATEGEKLSDVDGRITFNKVDFTYPTRPNNPILKGFDLEIEAGKTTALVGPSGGGKSTTVSLIERFYDPLAGSIELDGVDLKNINVSHLRGLIGYVGQEPTLFGTTIAGNIRYGNPNATQEEIETAAKSANAHDFIMSFPDGYNTQVGDKGGKLSGGQKQRIAIARVLVANPRILLLDEATSALDSESELVVQDALDSVVAERKRTTIVIAHRLSTIRNADMIAVISGGKVVEKGTHDELMASEDGHYRSLVDKQDRNSNNVSRENSAVDLVGLDESTLEKETTIAETGTPHFSFKDVNFAYPTRPKKKVFDMFNLEIRSGETVALVGPSGGGKSTTVALIERFYDAMEGTIEYQGTDIKILNLEWYRDQIGYVGQEPTLFSTTIAKNIAYGAPGATRMQIEMAAKQANIHDTIMSFPDGYDTEVGERGTQISGGQKQRVAIARALVKNPKVLLLDEATSALDSESEAIVQEALDKLMESKDHTTIVIAHRLSTIRNADRIAFIANGKVLEYGSHSELMKLPKGRYKRLVETQNRSASINAAELKKKFDQKKENGEEEEETPDYETEIEEAEKTSFSSSRAVQMAKPDAIFMLLGSIGSVFAGGVFPAWGVMFAQTITLLFRVIPSCKDDDVTAVNAFFMQEFDTCQDAFDWAADDMRQESFVLSAYWVIVAAGCIGGNMLTLWGFGMASERLNKRVRDSAFSALLRQEVAFFDKRSVGNITTQLEEDASKIHTFSGEPIRSFLIAMSSIITGIVLSFIFMWPFALVALGCIPLMGFATSIEMKQMLGEDEGDNSEKQGTEGVNQDELSSPGGIAVETLLNMRTVAALTLEKQRIQNYEDAISGSSQGIVKQGITAGLTSGLSMFIQQWVNALQLWFGGWILFNYSDFFDFNDFVISMFSLLFSLFGLGAAFNGLSDKKLAEKSAGRIFYLLDRDSKIDPLSTEGKKLD